ncbi:MAG: diversity-generating retroelement protein Avd, partial [Blastocatellia bacterium]
MKREQPIELAIIQKANDLILWFVPVLTKLPREYKFALGERMMTSLFDLLDELVIARFSREKLDLLNAINIRLERLRYQTKMLLEFKLIDGQRYSHASKLINAVGVDLGGWIKQQQRKK